MHSRHELRARCGLRAIASIVEAGWLALSLLDARALAQSDAHTGATAVSPAPAAASSPSSSGATRAAETAAAEPAPAVQAATLPASVPTASAASDAQDTRLQMAAVDRDAEQRGVEERAKRLGAWLEELAGASSSGTTGFFRILGGTFVVGEAGYMMFHHDRGSERWERGAISTVLLAFGALDIASGIYCLAGPDPDRERIARWRALGKVDALTLARFEGELAAEAALLHTLRIINAVNGFGLAAGGAVILGLTPVSNLHGDAAALAYITGAIFVALGLWDGIGGLVSETRSERAYRRYTAGEGVERAAIRLRVTPMLATTGAGVTFDAQF